jgi:hypothetical protein
MANHVSWWRAGWRGLGHAFTAVDLLRLLPGWGWIASTGLGLALGVLALMKDQPIWAAILIALAALVLSGGLILIIDTLHRRIKARASSPIRINKKIYAESIDVLGPNGDRVDGLHKCRFFIAVQNGRSDGSTLRRLTAKYHLFGQPAALRCRGAPDGFAIDLRNGETAYFELGHTYSGVFAGMPVMGAEPIEEPELDAALHDREHGHSRIRIAEDQPNRINISFPAGLEISDLAGWVIVAADDVKAAGITVLIDTRQLPELDRAFKMQPLGGL